MGPIFDWNGNLKRPVLNALRLGPDGARAQLVWVAMKGGRIAKAAKRVSDSCSMP